MSHYLFQENKPPKFPKNATVDMCSIWLLAVMDEGDRRRSFVASVLTYFYKRGYITDGQMTVLRDMASDVIGDMLAGALECQGGEKAASEVIDFGDVVEFPRTPQAIEVIE